MTNEEAIKILKSKMDGSVDTSYEWAEAVRMAIEALKVQTDFISKRDAIDAVQDVQADEAEYHYYKHYAKEALESLPSAEPLVLTCDGCRHVGTYDTDFPCSGCIRREKDYYEQEL